MIGQCLNPECSEELRYLSQGSVYAWETGEAREFHSEFFWLCPACSEALRVASRREWEAPSYASPENRVQSKGSRVRRVLATGYGDTSEA